MRNIIFYMISLIAFGCSSSNIENLQTIANYSVPVAVGLVATKSVISD